MSRIGINNPLAFKAGPYSHAVRSGDLLYVSGQAGVDPATGKVVEGGITRQVEQTFANIQSILQLAGLSFDHVIKVNVYLTDMNNFAAMNEVYARMFTQPYPARTTVGVASLPLGLQVEIEMIARA
jgi:2-iminobutanoate/2-iminopropanoate deaminase